MHEAKKELDKVNINIPEKYAEFSTILFHCKVKYSIEIFFTNIRLKIILFKLISGKTTNNQGRGKGTKRKMNTVENVTAKKLKK